jgi:hypothetical protein
MEGLIMKLYYLHFSGWHVSNTDLRALELLAYSLHLAGQDWTIATANYEMIIGAWVVGDPPILPPHF